jgi:hypothetical protein
MRGCEFRVQRNVDDGLGWFTGAEHHHAVRSAEPYKQICKPLLFGDVAAPPVVPTEPLQVHRSGRFADDVGRKIVGVVDAGE